MESLGHLVNIITVLSGPLYIISAAPMSCFISGCNPSSPLKTVIYHVYLLYRWWVPFNTIIEFYYRVPNSKMWSETGTYEVPIPYKSQRIPITQWKRLIDSFEISKHSLAYLGVRPALNLRFPPRSSISDLRSSIFIESIFGRVLITAGGTRLMQ